MFIFILAKLTSLYIESQSHAYKKSSHIEINIKLQDDVDIDTSIFLLS